MICWESHIEILSGGFFFGDFVIIMGNVNGREDGGGGSGVDNQSGGGDMAAEDGGELGDGEFMGPSPPSPRAARSPLMFTPQVCFFV